MGTNKPVGLKASRSSGRSPPNRGSEERVQELSGQCHHFVYLAAMFCMNTPSVACILSMGQLYYSMVPYTDDRLKTSSRHMLSQAV